MSEPIGVLVMAYGGPDSLADVEKYLLDVRGHRPTPQHIVNEVRRRYARIGGRSPILERTEAQAAALGAALARSNGARWDVAVGMRHWHPYIGDTLERMKARGVKRAVGIAMAPHYSRLSVEAYFREVAEAGSGLEVARIDSWHLAPGYVTALAARVAAAVARLPEHLRADAPVIFTAHSLPEKIREWDDPYPAQLAATVAAVVAQPALAGRPWRFAYQSAAMTPDPWLGPDVGDTLAGLAAEGSQAVVVAPVGFVSEHVEILYDLDCELAERADALGVVLERIDMLNDDPVMMADLARLVDGAAREAGFK
jgi:protoporphyrin/coproporphyrin ferrochelatase